VPGVERRHDHRIGHFWCHGVWGERVQHNLARVGKHVKGAVWCIVTRGCTWWHGGSCWGVCHGLAFVIDLGKLHKPSRHHSQRPRFPDTTRAAPKRVTTGQYWLDLGWMGAGVRQVLARHHQPTDERSGQAGREFGGNSGFNQNNCVDLT